MFAVFKGTKLILIFKYNNMIDKDIVLMRKNIGIYSNINTATNKAEKIRLKKYISNAVEPSDMVHYYKSEISDNLKILETFYSYKRLKNIVYFINELKKYSIEYNNYKKVDICNFLKDY